MKEAPQDQQDASTAKVVGFLTMDVKAAQQPIQKPVKFGQPVTVPLSQLDDMMAAGRVQIMKGQHHWLGDDDQWHRVVIVKGQRVGRWRT